MVTVKELYETLGKAIERGIGNKKVKILLSGISYDVSKYHCEDDDGYSIFNDDEDDN